VFANPFFRLKIGRFKATVHTVARPYTVCKTLDLADFATTWIIIRFVFVAHHGTSLLAANVRGLVITQTATTL
jgi:hypothetical protein